MGWDAWNKRDRYKFWDENINWWWMDHYCFHDPVHSNQASTGRDWGSWDAHQPKGNSATYHCADEDGFCTCVGIATYTRKCKKHGGCGRMSWTDVMDSNPMAHHMLVRGGTKCSNRGFKNNDPWSGYDKQCFCHPAYATGSVYGDPPKSQW